MKQDGRNRSRLLTTVASILGINLCFVILALIGMTITASLSNESPKPRLLYTPTAQVIRPPIENHEIQISGQSQDVNQRFQDLVTNQNLILSTQTYANQSEDNSSIAQTDPQTSFPLKEYKPGDIQSFTIKNIGTGVQSSIQAQLHYIGQHTFFWIKNGLAYDVKALQIMAMTFDQKIYPTTRAIFGKMLKNGQEAEIPIHILYTNGLGSTTAGYSSTGLIHFYKSTNDITNPYMIFLNADEVHLDQDYSYGVLAHELQHIIHRTYDKNEEIWLDEGLSEFATSINGYPLGSFVEEYTKDPDISLILWPGEDGNSTPHYGASYLFIKYLWGRFGNEAIKKLVNNPVHGLTSIDQLLDQFSDDKPSENLYPKADDLFLDWIVSNYVYHQGMVKEKYTYPSEEQTPDISATDKIHTCPSSWLTRTVNQYAVDYIDIACYGRYSIRFEGSMETALFPVHAHSGMYSVWARPLPAESQFTRTFDFSQVSPPINFNYWAWFDLEEDQNFVYLLVSTDGKTWRVLHSPDGKALTSRNSYFDWGYNGPSKGWIFEQVDLSSFSGQRIQLQFRSTGNAGASNSGFLLDDISIPQIGYDNNFEKNADEWQGRGYLRVMDAVPQTYRLAIIRPRTFMGVIPVNLDKDNAIDIPLMLNDRVTLVVTATSRLTPIPAAYRLKLSSIPDK